MTIPWDSLWSYVLQNGTYAIISFVLVIFVYKLLSSMKNQYEERIDEKEKELAVFRDQLLTKIETINDKIDFLNK